MRVVLMVASVGCVILMGLHAWRENLGPEWRVHQQRYATALTARASTDPERAAARRFDVRLRQVVLSDGVTVDRCVSCHVAIDDPRMTNEPVPLRTHPGKYLDTHPVERFGCTLCHDGQGLAVNNADAGAYTRDRFWEKPLLKAPFIEANCYRCHSDVLPGTPTYALGKQIFDGFGCIGCHRVGGRGGVVGPELSGIADASRHTKVPTEAHYDLVTRFNGNETLAYLYEAVRWPNAQPKVTAMPQFGFSDEEAVALVVYLKSLGRPATVVGLLPPPAPPVPPADPIERGRAAYGKYCIGCHGESGKGGIPNPNSKSREIAPLNTLAGRMSFASADQVTEFISIVRGLNGAPLDSSAAAKLANWPQIRQQIVETARVVAQGRNVAPADPRAPEPLDMPSWSHLMDAGQIDSVIYYLVSTDPAVPAPAPR